MQNGIKQFPQKRKIPREIRGRENRKQGPIKEATCLIDMLG